MNRKLERAPLPSSEEAQTGKTRTIVWAVSTAVALQTGLVLLLDHLMPDFDLGEGVRTVLQFILALGIVGAALMVLSEWLGHHIRVTVNNETRGADIQDVVAVPHLFAHAIRTMLASRWERARLGTKLGVLCYVLMALCILAGLVLIRTDPEGWATRALLVRAAFTLAGLGIVIIIGQNFLPHMGYSRRQRILG